MGRVSIRGIDVLPREKEAGRTQSRFSPLAPGLGLATLLALVAAACGSSGPSATPTTTHPTTSISTTSTSSTTTTTTAPVSQTTGPQTVLSPIGLNVRAGPSKSAKVIGTAEQGTVFQLVAHTNQAGGWYKVRGSTVTGWISADLGYSAPGRFGSYNSDSFSVLFPAGWRSAGAPRSGVVFRAPSSPEKVIITTAPSVAKLTLVSQGAGISEISSRQLVACGVTSYLFSYTTSSPDKYYAAIALALGAGHAIGLKATLTSLSEMRTVLDFVNSISFPVAACVGGPSRAHSKAPPTTTTAGTT